MVAALMAAKPTPGPWVEHPRDGIPAVGIDVNDGGELLPIVDVVHGRTKAEARANRRLIAVSPKLLSAALMLMESASPHMTHRNAKERAAYVLLRAAITKAQGTTS